MKLYFLKQNAVEILRVNIERNLEKYKEPTNDWIYDYFAEDPSIGDPFIEFKLDAPDFKLKIHRGGIAELDVMNAKILYKNLKDILTPSQASDERLWAGLTHGIFWEYMHNRWEMDIKEPSAESINARYFIRGTSKSGLTANTISRLWWLASKLYDETREDPLELLEGFGYDFVTKVYTFLSETIANSRVVTRSLARALMELEILEEARGSGRELFRALLRYLNILGGVTILDFYDEDVLVGLLVDEGMKVLGSLGDSSYSHQAKDLNDFPKM